MIPVATLKILSSFELPTQGRSLSGKQGEATDDVDDAFEVTVTGTVHEVIGVLATATVVTVYDDDNDVPADFDFAYVWADEDFYVQIIYATTNVVFKVEAFVPFWIPGFDTGLAAASTTAITGGTEPTLEDIDSIVLGNYSGNSMNYHFVVID